MITREQILELPKAELHVHFEGSVSPGILRELADRNGIDLEAPVALPDMTHPIAPPPGLAAGRPRMNDFHDFIAIYLKTTQTIQNEADVVTIARAILESAKEQHIRAIESYFSPTTFRLFGVALEPLFDGLAEAQRLARADYSIALSWIFDIVRNTSRDGMEAIEIALEARTRGVEVGAIGLAGYEAARPARQYVRAFERARAEGFRTLAHAGETAGPESVAETIQLLNPERIGHGIRAVEEERVLDLIVQSQIPVEVSPWSNISLQITSEENHPLCRMLEAGMNIVLSADDPGIFQRDLTDNFLYAARRGIPLGSLERLAANSVALAQH